MKVMDREQKLLVEMAKMNLLDDPKLTVSYRYLINLIYFGPRSSTIKHEL